MTGKFVDTVTISRRDAPSSAAITPMPEKNSVTYRNSFDERIGRSFASSVFAVSSSFSSGRACPAFEPISEAARSARDAQCRAHDTVAAWHMNVA